MTEDQPDRTGDDQGNGAKRKRVARSFPAMTFEGALEWAHEVYKFGSGKPIRRMSLLESLGRSPSSSAARQNIASSNQYGLTLGGHNAEQISLTEKGLVATDPSSAPAARAQARVELAILGIEPFKGIFDKYVGSRLPVRQALQDAARELGVADEHVAECVDTFLANAVFVGLIRQIGGAEHVVSVADALDQLPDGATQPALGLSQQGVAGERGTKPTPSAKSTSNTLDDVCFVISPIGDEYSEQRKHADLMLNHLIVPAVESLNLRAVRADTIGVSGMITAQVMEYLVRAKLVIADLSFANPNVYYELAVRHAARKPAVQVTRTSDPLPFDVGQFRTVMIDMSDIYTLIPALELHVSAIASQARSAIEAAAESESPISKFYPRFWEELPSV